MHREKLFLHPFVSINKSEQALKATIVKLVLPVDLLETIALERREGLTTKVAE